MDKLTNHSESLNQPQVKTLFSKLYGDGQAEITNQISRYKRIIANHTKLFGAANIRLFSTPGRTEIGGNHTDHNHGRVLAGSVNLDTIAAAGKTSDNTIIIHSENYTNPFIVSLDDLEARAEEAGTTTALIRGIAAKFKATGYLIGGFNAYISSDVGIGSGLSSSASIEVLIGTILNTFYNGESIPVMELAKIGQYAENIYFKKPCGLMDQIACGVGGIVSIDFNDPQNPIVRKVDFDFAAQNYSLLIVDTGGSHVDLTEDYAAVPNEMKELARNLGKEVCRELTYQEIIDQMIYLRAKVGDRAILRALHFFNDNERVTEQVQALEQNDFESFLRLVNDSGNSSVKWLQNCYSTQNPSEQGISLALALTENYLENIAAGACRVHGGGFAGTIQVFLPNEHIGKYKNLMDKVFGESAVTAVTIRPVGTTQVKLNE